MKIQRLDAPYHVYEVALSAKRKGKFRAHWWIKESPQGEKLFVWVKFEDPKILEVWSFDLSGERRRKEIMSKKAFEKKADGIKRYPRTIRHPRLPGMINGKVVEEPKEKEKK